MENNKMRRILFKWRVKVGVFATLLAACLCLAGPVQAAEDTRYDVGMNLPFNPKAGNVNPQTGNVTLNFSDLELPGRGQMSFQLSRFWNLNQANAFNMYCDAYDGSNKLSSETIEQYNRMGVGWSTKLDRKSVV